MDESPVEGREGTGKGLRLPRGFGSAWVVCEEELAEVDASRPRRCLGDECAEASLSPDCCARLL